MLLIHDTTDRAAAMRFLQRVEPHAVDGATAEQMAAGCHVLDVREHGRAVGAVAVAIDGKRATITAAAGEGECTYEELELLEASLKAHGVEVVGLSTRRPALIRRLAQGGYTITECKMQKAIHGR